MLIKKFFFWSEILFLEGDVSLWALEEEEGRGGGGSTRKEEQGWNSPYYISPPCSDVDPDPYSDWIRIQEGKNDPQKIEKVNKFEVLDVLFWGLKASPVAWTSSWGLEIGKMQFLTKKTIFIWFFSLLIWSSKPWIRIGSGSGFIWNAGYGSGYNESGCTTLLLVWSYLL